MKLRRAAREIGILLLQCLSLERLSKREPHTVVARIMEAVDLEFSDIQ